MAKPLRPYMEPEPRPSRDSGEPIPGSTLDLQRQRTQTDYENRLGWGSQAADANYEIVDRSTNRPVFLFIANTDTEAWRKYSEWLAAAGLPEDTEDFGWRPRGARGQHAQSGRQQAIQQAQSQPSGEWTGAWLILDPQGREIHRITGIGNVQSDANRHAIEWMRQRPGTLQAGVTVVPEMR